MAVSLNNNVANNNNYCVCFYFVQNETKREANKGKSRTVFTK